MKIGPWPRSPDALPRNDIKRWRGCIVDSFLHEGETEGVRWLVRSKLVDRRLIDRRRAGGGTSRRRAGNKSVDTRHPDLLSSRLRRGSSYRPLGDQA